MTPRKTSKKRRHSQASLDALVYVLVKMLNEMTWDLPRRERAQVLDGVLQHLVQVVNLWQDRQGGKPIHRRSRR